MSNLSSLRLEWGASGLVPGTSVLTLLPSMSKFKLKLERPHQPYVHDMRDSCVCEGTIKHADGL